MSASYRSQTPQSQRQPASSSTADGNASSSSNAAGSKISASPFVSNPHGHPSFNPVKIGTKGTGDSKTPKQPKAPDKPLMPYMRYSRKVSRLVWDSVKASNPDLKLWEIGKIIGQMWRELSDDEKQEYLDEYDAEKLQYTEAMKAYHNSPAYQTWLSAKGKTDLETESEEPEKTRRSKAPAAGSASAGHLTEARSVTIQPCEDDDDGDDTYSIKHVAAARFHRNHCLINEIFSDAVVPDVRTVINEGRMAVLKRQVVSLTMHQKKLEGELETIEQRHASKKSQFSQNSERFYEELAKLCNEKPQVSEEQFTAMVLKAKEELKEKQRQVLQQQQQQVQEQHQQQQQRQQLPEIDGIKPVDNGALANPTNNTNGSTDEKMDTSLNGDETNAVEHSNIVNAINGESTDSSANVEKQDVTSNNLADKVSNSKSSEDPGKAADTNGTSAATCTAEAPQQVSESSESANDNMAAKEDDKPITDCLGNNGSETKVLPGNKRKHEGKDSEDAEPTKQPKLDNVTAEDEKVNSTNGTTVADAASGEAK